MALVRKSTTSSGRVLIISVVSPVAPGALSYFIFLLLLLFHSSQGFDQSFLIDLRVPGGQRVRLLPVCCMFAYDYGVLKVLSKAKLLLPKILDKQAKEANENKN
jgi:hypothetical protein